MAEIKGSAAARCLLWHHLCDAGPQELRQLTWTHEACFQSRQLLLLHPEKEHATQCMVQPQHQKVERASCARVEPLRLVAASWAFTARATSLATMGAAKPHFTCTHTGMLRVLLPCELSADAMVLGADLGSQGHGLRRHQLHMGTSLMRQVDAGA